MNELQYSYLSTRGMSARSFVNCFGKSIDFILIAYSELTLNYCKVTCRVAEILDEAIKILNFFIGRQESQRPAQ